MKLAPCARGISVVTGAAGGIGSATASRLAEMGWSLLLCDLDVARLDAVAGPLRAASRPVEILAADLADACRREGRIERRRKGAYALSKRAIQSAIERSALPRLGLPDEIAGVVAFLCSSAASFVTGCDIRVDGGALVALGL